MEMHVMAKKPARQTEEESGPKRTVLTIKGSPEWKAWFERFSDFVRTPGSTLVDHALIRHAREMGFTEEAPKR
jgi:hypothetical protein